MNNFKSIIIPDEIIIVENKKGQGYIVNPDNTNMYESALNWANGWSKDFTPITHKYKNGQFKLSLKECADQSYNGGKLSFWNCNVICPDGVELLIGINQETLCLLLMACTSINGDIQEDIYLGTYKGNGAAFTENQIEYIEAKNQSKLRNKEVKKTSKYIPGDIVGTIKDRFLYLGEFDCYFDVNKNYYWEDKHYDSRRYNIYGNKCKKHIFLDIDKNNEISHYLNEYNVKEKKTSYFIFDHMNDIDINALFNRMLKEQDYSELRKLCFIENIEEVKDRLYKHHYKFHNEDSKYILYINDIKI